MTTFSEVLARQLRSEPGRPLITFYDGATGERTELSVTTYANWVAKAASLLVDELGLERGQTLRLDLPPHWLGTVFLGAAWAAGLVVTDADAPDVVLCGPDTLPRWSARSRDVVVLATALLPMGVRFAAPVPPDVHDVGVEIWGQPDAFVAYDPPGDDDPAVVSDDDDDDDVGRTQGELWAAASAGSLLADGGRLLTEANPASPPGTHLLAEPLARSGSLVLVVRTERVQLDAIHAAERATARFPA